MFKRLLDKYNSLPVQIKASFWFLVCSVLQRSISIVTVPVFTRLMTSAEYGQYVVFSSWERLVSVFVSLNLSANVYMRGLVVYEDNRREFVSSMQGLSFMLLLFWLGIYFAFTDFWNNLFNLPTPLMLFMLAEIWITSVFSFWVSEQRVDYKYKKILIVTLMVSILTPILGIWMVLNSQDKVLARIGSSVTLQIFIYLWFFFIHLKNGKSFFNKQYWRYALLFNIPLIPHYLSTLVLSCSDRIMIANMVDSRSAGIYGFAYSISMVLIFFNLALNTTIEPWLYKKLKTKDFKSISKIAYSSFSLIAGVNLILIAFAPEIISIFAPKEYFEAIWIVPPVTMSVYFIYSYTFFSVFEFFFKKTGYITTATIVGAVLNIVLNYIFIQKFGYYAAGYTTLICYIIFVVAHYCFMRKICRDFLDDVRVYSLKVLLKITLLFMAAGFSFLATYGNTPARYSLIVALFIIVLACSKSISNLGMQLIDIKKNG
ncbi:MAG: oligosaccharide flippase family protein [Candidatus Riflebacteria bacterium]|nr:oligosaccharide flippase family protein [Candidatus Riflebacteria bacterium]